MKTSTVEVLRSPDTGNPLSLDVIEGDGDEVIVGRLIDAQTGQWFRLENGIPELTPAYLKNTERFDAFRLKYGFEPDATRPLEDQSARDLRAYREQTDFFRDYQKKYEIEVVDSRFYRIFDQVTFGSWINSNLSMGQRVVEIGCGSGRQTVPLLQLGCDVIGIDLSEEMLISARKKVIQAGGRADFIVATAECLPIRNSLADVAIIFGSLHHFPDPKASVAEAARLIRTGGSFYMVEPHDSLLRPVFDFSMRVMTLWEEEAADEPLFDAEQWNGWFRRSGLKAKISYSTVLPPHLFYLTGHSLGVWLLKISDKFINSIPGIRRLGGVIVADGRKI